MSAPSQNFPCPNCGRCDYRWLGHVFIDGMQCCEHCETGGIQAFEKGLEEERIAANELSNEIERLEALRVAEKAEAVDPVEANWTVELNCECPACKKYVDLLSYPDFWDGRSDFKLAEHGTERSDALRVDCPECGAEFIVCCTY